MSDYVPGMTTEPFTPHADSIQTAWVIMCQQSRIATQPPVEKLEAEFDRFIARIKAEAVSEALRELLDDATSVKDEHGHVEGYVPEWAVRDELDRIEESGL